MRACRHLTDRARLLASTVASLAIGVPSASAQDSSALALQPMTFVSAKGDSVAAEMGTLKVPENRKVKDSKAITIAFVRFRSTTARPGPPIIYLAGGPGNSGIDAARGTRFPLFMALRAYGDVIGLDQRGMGESRPLLGCRERQNYPLDRIGDRDQVIAVTREQARTCATFWQSRGVDVRGFNADESADDVDAVRQAVGAPQVTLWGISYGTTLALNIIRRHPTRVHKAILAGLEGTDDMLKRPSMIDSMLVTLARLTRNDSVVGPDVPDLVAMMRATMAKLEREPVTVRIANPASAQSGDSVTVTMGKYDYQWVAYAIFGTAEYTWFPGFVWTTANGNFRLMARSVARERQSGIGQAVTFATDCYSGASPERRRLVAEEAPRAIVGNVINLVYPEVCDVWDAGDAGEAFRRGVSDSEVPALFISGTLDARTPPAQAEAARKGFRKSLHLVVDGAAHSDPLFLSSPKILEAMQSFMERGTIPTDRIQLQIRFEPVRKFPQ